MIYFNQCTHNPFLSFYYCINDPKEAKRRPKYHYFNFITSYAVFTLDTNYENSVSLSIMFERKRRIGNLYKNFNKKSYNPH